MKNARTIICLILLSISISGNGQILKKLKKLKKDVEKSSENVEDIIKVTDNKDWDNQHKRTNDSIDVGRKQRTIRPEMNSGNDGLATMSFNTVSYSSPNKNLDSLVLPSFKGLPRIGDLPRSHEINIRFKTNNFNREIRSYFALAAMQLALPDFSDFERDIILRNQKISQEPSQNQIKSFIIQSFLLDQAILVLSDDAFLKYFNSRSSQRRVKSWGGDGANEFEQNKNYKLYLDDNFESVKTLSEQVPTEFYLVRSYRMEGYNFERKGFEVALWRTNLAHEDFGNSQRRNNLKFTPKNAFEEKLTREGNNVYKFFMPISETKAQEIIERDNREIFAIYKLQFDKAERNYEGVKREPSMERLYSDDKIPYYLIYHFKNPVVEFYADVELTDKIFDLNLE